MERRFSDDVGKVASMQEVPRDKPETTDISDIARMFRLSEDELQCEWRIVLSEALQSGCKDIIHTMAYARSVNDDLTDTAAELSTSTGSGSVSGLTEEINKPAAQHNVHIEIDVTADVLTSSN